MAHIPNPTANPSTTQRLVFQGLTAKRRAVGTSLGGTYEALMNHPALAQRLEELGYFLKWNGSLPGDAREFIILRSARLDDCPQIWATHTDRAKECGLPEKVVDSILRDTVETLDEPYSLLVQLMDVVRIHEAIPQELMDELVYLYDLKGLLEAVVLCGFYDLFASLSNGFEIGMPEGKASSF